MKTFHLPVLVSSLLLTANFLTAQVTNNLQLPTSVNSTGAAPDASAILDVSANNKGILVPRITSAERVAIVSPATGLLVFDTTTGGFWFYNGTAWLNLSVHQTLADANNDTKIQVEEMPDEDIIRFDISGAEFGKMDGKTFHLHAGNSLFIGNNAGQNADVNYNNTFLGVDAGALTTTGSQNVFVGTEAGKNNTGGVNSTFVGYQAGFNNNTGIENTFIGRWAGRGNTTGIGNTFIGKEAGLNNTDAQFNTFVGKEAGNLNNTGDNNTFIGERAGNNNGNGSNNTFLGKQAGTNNVSGSGNVFLGFMAGANETGSNRLYIENSSSSSPLIYGEFDNNRVGIGTNTPATPLDVNGATRTIGLTTTSISAHDNGVGNRTVIMYGGNGDQWLNFRRGGNPTGVAGMIFSDHSGEHHFLYNNGDYLDFKYSTEASDDPDVNHASVVTRLRLRNSDGNFGIGRSPVTNKLEVEGDASKSSAGDWLANSDARLKKNIRALNSQLMLQSLLALQGIAYEWDDDKTGSKRPDGIQYGFTAQNIQEVFPTLVEEDKLGYLQTAYGTYDAMTVEAIRALHEEIEKLETENAAQQAEIERLWKVEGQLDKITAALAGAGISVEK